MFKGYQLLYHTVIKYRQTIHCFLRSITTMNANTYTGPQENYNNSPSKILLTLLQPYYKRSINTIKRGSATRVGEFN